ncbi:hypothetical protein JB92DRAFT_1704128 [Gautieria morchelliformis]|nr:hypothetical protein JB92DRAFT_1704128 [Gautieria morchelliformis]
MLWVASKIIARLTQAGYACIRASLLLLARPSTDSRSHCASDPQDRALNNDIQHLTGAPCERPSTVQPKYTIMRA